VRVTKCRVCEGELEELWELGDFALCGSFSKPDEEVPVAPMGISVCNNCTLVQMHYSYPQNLFSEGYGYRSGLNPWMVKHLSDLSQEAAIYSGLWAGDTVIDIGGNDGTLLKNFGDGFNKILIDPTAEKWREFHDPSIKVIAKRFSKDLVIEKARLIFSVAMFYDLEDPVGFAKDVAECLLDDGLWVLEQSYLPTMVRANAFDTICHEHLEYYTITSLQEILRRAGLDILGVSFNDANGGSFRVYAGRGERLWEFAGDQDWNVKEQINGLKSRVDAIKQWFQENLQGRIFGYGASTKGNTLLQYFGLKLPYIVDVNPYKWGKVTPGTRIPIISEEEGERLNPDAYLVLPWHFKEFFLKNKPNHKFIFPLPCVERR
jgi:hypothetical protein